MALPTPQLRNFDLNLLKIFDVVMAERSLTRAAQVLSLTLPAVSYALRRLREALGDEVLVRRIARLVDMNEYKRRQCPPGVRVSTKAFGKDRRLPITNRYAG